MYCISKLADEFIRVRRQSEQICQPLAIEDYGLQAMANTSPPKWHLAHTTWFFETFILKPFVPGYQPVHTAYEHLFNSYYNGIGAPFPRPQRGLLSRPTVDEVYSYRERVDEAMLELFKSVSENGDHREVLKRTELGLHHEQQHQELLLTDLKYSLHINPLLPAYRNPGGAENPAAAHTGLNWREYQGGLVTVGAGDGDFHFDNETPRHRCFLEPFALATRPVSNGEFLDFIADGGYQRADLWLADGWDTVQSENWQCPLYWRRIDGDWGQYTLAGEQRLVATEPACHLSYYEAEAFARWAGARLPSEAEWEFAAQDLPVVGNLLGSGRLHPQPADPESNDVQQLYGDVWEWTASSYQPYPGFSPAPGTIGEYSGKFMINQMVLRGGSCVSDAAHIRSTYRNFFYPADRWQFSGIRLAKSL